MRLMCFMLILLNVFICGCVATKVEYKQVYIPIKCDVPKRERPQRSTNIVETLKSILVYTMTLEKDLQICRGEK